MVWCDSTDQMDNKENPLQPGLENGLQQGNTWSDLAEMSRNSEQLMERVSNRLDALNTALDHLEERTDRVLLELRQLAGTENNQRRDREDRGDPGANE